MKKSNKILIGGGIIAAGIAAAATASYLVTKKLVKMALDRDTAQPSEKSVDKVAGSQIITPEGLEFIEEYSEKLKNSIDEVVSTVSADGVKLIGHLHKCENPKRIIIAMHGWRSSWARDFCAISEFWHENDCIVLYADQRGQGESEGEYMGFGLIERHDCLDWINWALENLDNNLPIYLAGLSMGATTVLMATGLELPENVHGVMADCGFTSPNDIWKHVAENNLHIPYGGITESLADNMCRKKIQIGAKDYSSIMALKEAKVPVLFIHGTDDHFVPVEMTYENYKACASPKRLLIVPGAEHALSYVVDKEAYQSSVKDFWKEFD